MEMLVRYVAESSSIQRETTLEILCPFCFGGNWDIAETDLFVMTEIYFCMDCGTYFMIYEQKYFSNPSEWICPEGRDLGD